jgi:hypothetical protein
MKISIFTVLSSLAASLIFAVANAFGGDSKFIQPPIEANGGSTLFPTGIRSAVLAETANGNVDPIQRHTATLIATHTTTAVLIGFHNQFPEGFVGIYQVKTTTKVTRRITTSDHLLHNALGGGVQSAYFFNRYIGVSLEGDFLGSYDYNTVATGNFIFRYPFEFGAGPASCAKNGKSAVNGPIWGVAPYVTIGGGGQWDGHAEGIGSVGGGLEFAFQHNYGAGSSMTPARATPQQPRA